jgi:hypothetical protein
VSRDDYIEVKDRIALFVEKYPNGSLQSEYEMVTVLDHQWLIVKAWAYRDPEDPRPGIGHAWEHVPGRTPYTIGSELMVGETSAWGRALAAIGIAVSKSIASKDEVKAAGNWEKSKRVPDDDSFYSSAPPPEPAAPASSEDTYTPSPGRYATPKQLGLIKGLARDAGFKTDEQVLGLVNAALTAAGLTPVSMLGQLARVDASKAIEQIKNSTTVEGFVSGG